MKIPKQLKVGSKMYKIEYCDLLASEGVNGITYNDQQVIKLDPKLPQTEIDITFLHEALHACWNFVGLSRDIEEDVITKLSPILYTVIKENKL